MEDVNPDLLTALTRLIFGERARFWPRKSALDMAPAHARAEGIPEARESGPIDLTGQIPGGNPETPTPLDAMFGLAMSGGAIGAANPRILRAGQMPEVRGPASTRRIQTDRVGNVIRNLDDLTPEQAREMFGPPLKYEPGLRKLPEDRLAKYRLGPGETKQPLGFPKEGPAKGYESEKYSFELPVKITWEDGMVHTDVIRGLNRQHALERARANWPDASFIEPLMR